LTFDINTLSDDIRRRVFEYGFEQKTSDSHSSAKGDVAAMIAGTEAIWEVFDRGEWNLRGAADRIALAAIDWDKLAEVIRDIGDPAQADARVARVDALRPSLTDSDKARAKKRATVRKVLAIPDVAEAMGIAQVDVDDLLGI